MQGESDLIYQNAAGNEAGAKIAIYEASWDANAKPIKTSTVPLGVQSAEILPTNLKLLCFPHSSAARVLVLKIGNLRRPQTYVSCEAGQCSLAGFGE